MRPPAALLTNEDFLAQQSILMKRIRLAEATRQSPAADEAKLARLVTGQLQAEVRAERARMRDERRRDPRQIVAFADVP